MTNKSRGRQPQKRTFSFSKDFSSYQFQCVPQECEKEDKFCCRFFDIDVTQKEMDKIINHFDVIAGFCRNLKEGNSYGLPFSEQDRRYTIDKKENGDCFFTYRDSSGLLRCGIHSAALKLKVEPASLKPLPCSVWPVRFIKGGNQKLHLDIDKELKAPCVRIKKKNEPTADDGISSILPILESLL